jgi:guanylate kinase
MTGTLYIVSAPSGAGKTSLVDALVRTMPDLKVSVSHTTRPKRPGEIEGTHYHFVDAAIFERMAAAGDFLEHARVFGNLYGTSREQVLRNLEAGTDVILEIDWQGGRQVRQAFADSVSIFILPPSRDELERRLRGRNQDSDSVIAKRMQEAVNEMSHFREYDYLVVNDTFDDALTDLKAIVRARRLRCSVQIERLGRRVNELLAEGNEGLAR